MSVVAFQIMEEYWQVPVAEKIGVAHVASCPLYCPVMLQWSLTLYLFFCKNCFLFLQKITTSRLVKSQLLFWRYNHILIFLHLLDAFLSQLVKLNYEL